MGECTMSISIDDIKKAVEAVNNNKYRIRNNKNLPGGLIDISQINIPAIVIGDLHGSIENLDAIMSDNGNREKVKRGELFLILVGDSVHNDQTGEMLEMDTSLAVIERLFELCCDLKDNMAYIRGNHDSFDERVAKSGIRQGYEFKKFLLEKKGEEYVEAVNDFFEALPHFVVGSNFAITHAGPVRRGATREELVNIDENFDLKRQLIWNRVHEFRGNPSLKEYGGEDISKMLEKLKLSPDSYFIVGHNPLWQTGNTTGIWQDVTGIKNHIIIISNRQTNGPYLLITEGKVLEKYAIEKKMESYYGW